MPSPHTYCKKTIGTNVYEKTLITDHQQQKQKLHSRDSQLKKGLYLDRLKRLTQVIKKLQPQHQVPLNPIYFSVLAADNYLVPIPDVKKIRFYTLILWLHTKITVHE